ncbi:MAG TPA: NUDIX hydrolase [Salinimicrobium sp.]|nr:NUDIX hydrolase [Salinimicrobium sp.]
MGHHQNIAVTTDCAIFYSNKKEIKILLVQRKNEPFKGKWALPGGFLEEDEPLETGARRELQEETGLQVKNLQQIKAFGALGRDPRGRTISIAFWGEVFTEEKVQAADDAQDARWFETTKLPELAFDHKKIIELAIVKYYSKNE